MSAAMRAEVTVAEPRALPPEVGEHMRTVSGKVPIDGRAELLPRGSVVNAVSSVMGVKLDDDVQDPKSFPSSWVADNTSRTENDAIGRRLDDVP